MWSRNYQSCTECSTTEAKHYGGGLCSRCYKREQYRQDPEVFKAREASRYLRKAEYIKARASRYYYANQRKMAVTNKRRREEKCFSGYREAVLSRDGHKCSSCGATEQLVVHHIDGTGRGHKKPNNDPTNLVTLCRSCHCIVHKPRLKR